MECPSCKHENSETTTFCSDCGHQFLQNKALIQRKIHNKYIEFRKWKLAWGLLFDSQEEVNKYLTENNERGFRCVHYQMGLVPHLSILRLLWVTFVFGITFGFVQYWIGPTFLFEKIDA